jgi:hypothetical protein
VLGLVRYWDYASGVTFFFSHPPPELPHPWHDPLETPPLGAEQPPEWAVPGAPDPRDFPFDDQGQRDYYVAVSNVAVQRQPVLMGAGAKQAAAMQEAQTNTASEQGKREFARAQFLLLLS